MGDMCRQGEDRYFEEDGLYMSPPPHRENNFLEKSAFGIV
jgi:hypothetical protein